MAITDPVLPLQDFQRISNSIAGMIIAEGASLIGKCLLFGIMGEWLLRDIYKIADARAKVGAFAVCVAPAKAISFAGHDGTVNNRQNFHCWVEAGGFAFDFSSFLYPALARASRGLTCQALMFQKPLAEIANAMDSLKNPGEFYLLEDCALREETIAPALRAPAFLDVLEILVEWYLPPPKAMKMMYLENQAGNSKPTSVHNAVLYGAW